MDTTDKQREIIYNHKIADITNDNQTEVIENLIELVKSFDPMEMTPSGSGDFGEMLELLEAIYSNLKENSLLLYNIGYHTGEMEYCLDNPEKRVA